LLYYEYSLSIALLGRYKGVKLFMGVNDYYWYYSRSV